MAEERPENSTAARIAHVRERIARAAAGVGRDPGEITLIAVTKTVGADRIREALAAGIRDFGENYYQEVREKLPLFGPEVRWHFIGHLQTNKARYIAGRFALVQSVDSERLARELGRRADSAGTVQPVLMEAKLDPAEARFGVPPESVLELAERLTDIPGIRLDGLMGMPPFGLDQESVRPYFARLRGLFERLPPENRRVLSMGMTADYTTAIEEGATMVRVGTAIFGARRQAIGV